MKQHQGKIIAAAFILCVLAAAYFWGGNYTGRDVSSKTDAPVSTAAPNQTAAPDLPDTQAGEKPAEATASHEPTNAPNIAAKPFSPPPAQQLEDSSKGVYNGSESYSETQGMEINLETGKDKYLTGPVPEGKPVPVEPQDALIKNTAYTCALSVRCDTILKNMNCLDKEKVELVPEDGVIFPAAEVTFYEGESVLNVLQREMKKNKIHLEFRNTPIYNSAYIEGIANLYEFDCGELSGWMYKVNGWFPNYGCSRYQLKDGDAVEWVYTCDLGRDVGGYYAPGGQ